MRVASYTATARNGINDMDEYYTIRIRVNNGKMTGFETSSNTPCILADALRGEADRFFDK